MLCSDWCLCKAAEPLTCLLIFHPCHVSVPTSKVVSSENSGSVLWWRINYIWDLPGLRFSTRCTRSHLTLPSIKAEWSRTIRFQLWPPRRCVCVCLCLKSVYLDNKCMWMYVCIRGCASALFSKQSHSRVICIHRCCSWQTADNVCVNQHSSHF